jgi:hypothetical protein
MQIAEMHYQFKVKVDKVDSLKNRNFLPAEIDWLLNEAIDIFVEQRYKPDSTGVGFEVDQTRIDELSTLVIKYPLLQPAITPTLVANGIYKVELSKPTLAYDYRHLIRVSGKMAKQGCTTKIFYDPMVVQHDDLTSSLTNYHNKPDFQWGIIPMVIGKGNQNSALYLYTNGDFIIPEVHLEYIKKPDKVSIGGYTYIDGNPSLQTNCDLPEKTHREIVDIAALLAKGDLENPNLEYNFNKVVQNHKNLI